MVKEEECICRASVTAMRTIDGDLCQRVVPLFAYLARWTMNIACWGKAQILNAKVPYILQTGFQIAVGSTVSDIAGNTKYFVPHNTYARCHSACKTHSIIRNRSALRRTCVSQIRVYFRVFRKVRHGRICKCFPRTFTVAYRQTIR